MSNPFKLKNGCAHLDVVSRLHALEKFNYEQLIAALAVPNLQKTVERKIKAKLRKIEQEGEK